MKKRAVGALFLVFSLSERVLDTRNRELFWPRYSLRYSDVGKLRGDKVDETLFGVKKIAGDARQKPFL